jgi:hypothetical protein
MGMLTPLSGKLQASFNTIKPKWSPSFQVRDLLRYNIEADEVKYGLKMPTRFAIRSAKLTYLEKVQEEVNKYLAVNIKHDYLRPDKALTLNLTIKEAELLTIANASIKEMADKGELKNLHERCRAL